MSETGNRSTPSQERSRAAAWWLIAVAAPMVYLLTVPPVYWFGMRLHTQGFHQFGPDAWAGIYVRPYGWLSGVAGLDSPLEAYWIWWMERLPPVP